MQYKNIFEDFYGVLPVSGDTAVTYYRIEDEDGITVYSGKAYGAYPKVNVAQRIRDWLDNEIGDFRESDGDTFEHPDALRAFSLITSGDTIVDQWMVLFTLEPWSGNLEFLTTAINTHASPAQKLFFTNGTPTSGGTEDIEDGGPGDGPGGGDDGLYFDVDGSVSVQPGGGYVSVEYTTNIPESEITPVIPEGWTLVSFANGVITFNIPENTGAERIVTTVPYVHKGATLGTTVVTQYAYADNYFIIDGETHIPFEGGDYTYTISTSCSGYSVNLPSGVTIVTMSSSSITLNYSANNTDDDRYLQIEFIPNCAYSVTLDVFQDSQQEGEYLTLTFYEDSSGRWDGYVNDLYNDSYYSLNGGAWTLISGGSGFFFSQGAVVRLKGRNGFSSTHSQAIIHDSDSYGTVYADVSGNILSSFVGDDFRSYRRSSFVSGGTRGDSTGWAYKMFSGLKKLRDAKNICMPIHISHTLEYGSMFAYCETLRSAPALPARKLTHQCYRSMFSDCPSLVTAPDLPGDSFFSGMDGFYTTMFARCTSLENVPERLPMLKLADYCYSGMFVQCTKLETAPDILATDFSGVTDACYHMFYGCSNLSSVTCLATNGYTGNFEKWLNGVSASGTFTKKYGSQWPSGVNGIPDGWTVVTE